MADETPVAAPAEAVDQPERETAAGADKPADQETENVNTTEDKPTGKLHVSSLCASRLIKGNPKLPHVKMWCSPATVNCPALFVRPQSS